MLDCPAEVRRPCLIEVSNVHPPKLSECPMQTSRRRFNFIAESTLRRGSLRICRYSKLVHNLRLQRRPTFPAHLLARRNGRRQSSNDRSDWRLMGRSQSAQREDLLSLHQRSRSGIPPARMPQPGGRTDVTKEAYDVKRRIAMKRSVRAYANRGRRDFMKSLRWSSTGLVVSRRCENQQR